MSQEKVEYNKEQKANMKKNVKKRKIEARIGAVVAVVLAVVIIGWFGYSVKKTAEKHHEENPVTNEVNLKALINFSTED